MAGVDEQGSNQQIQQTLANMKKNNQLLIGLDNMSNRRISGRKISSLFRSKSSEQLQAELPNEILKDITSAVEQQKPELTFKTIIRRYIGVTYREDENEKKADDIAGVIFYYLLKRETPDNAHLFLIILVSCTDLVLSITTTSRKSVEGWSDLKWNETCLAILGDRNVFVCLLQLLVSNSLSLESILNAGSTEKLYELLSARDNYGRTVLHFQTELIIDLLIKTPAAVNLDKLYNLLSVRDFGGDTVLHTEAGAVIYLLIKTRAAESLPQLYQLLLLRNNHGDTAFHCNTESIYVLLMKTCTAENSDEIYRFLFIRDKYGQTVLHLKTKLIVDSLIEAYSDENIDQLYELLSVKDKIYGQTVLHLKTKLITDFLIKTGAAENADILCNLLSIQDNHGDTVLHLQSELVIDSLKSSYFAEKLDKLFQLLSLQNIHGQTVLHLENESVISLLIETHAAENLDKLYDLLSVKDNIYGQTVLHLKTKLIIDLLIKTGAAENSDKLYNLLSIQDLDGYTALHLKAEPVVDLLIDTYSAKESDKLFELLSLQNVHGKTVSHLETKLIVKLLVTTRAAEKLDQLLELLSIQDNDGCTVLQLETLWIAKLLIVHSAENSEKLLQLLLVPNKNGQTVLHSNAELMIDLLMRAYSPKNSDKLYRLLSVQDNAGRTALHFNTKSAIDLLIKTHAAENSDKLYQLLRVQDDFGNTVLHLNSELVIHLLVKLYSPQDFEKLFQFINIKNQQDHIAPFTEDIRDLLVRGFDNNGDINDLYQLISNWFKVPVTFFEANYNWILELLIKFYSTTNPDEYLNILQKIAAPQSSPLSDWLVKQAENRCYLLYHEPTVLIFYTTFNREGAEEEAQSIIDSFLSINYHNTKIQRDKSKDKTLELIKEAAGEAKSALIVVFMSHGTETGDSLQDSEGESIKFTEIESAMCEEENLKDKPKVLIAQCCRRALNSREREAARVADPAPSQKSRTHDQRESGYRMYEASHDHYFALMSTIIGTLSQRKLFIPLLAEQIRKCKENQTIIDIAHAASSQISKESRQVPMYCATLQAPFCPANYYGCLAQN